MAEKQRELRRRLGILDVTAVSVTILFFVISCIGIASASSVQGTLLLFDVHSGTDLQHGRIFIKIGSLQQIMLQCLSESLVHDKEGRMKD